MLRYGSSTSLFGLTAALVVTGCSGGAGNPTPARDAATLGVAQHSAVAQRSVAGVLLPAGLSLPSYRRDTGSGWLSPAAKRAKALLYVADQGAGTIRIYNQKGTNQQPIGAITTGLSDVDGLFVDSNRNLYAANFGTGTVTVYPPGATSPSLTLTGAGSPKDVVVATDGTVYVANFNEGTNGTVLEYGKGQTTPSRTVVTFGAGSFPEGLAIDSTNNLYVAYNTNDGQVLKFAAGGGSGTNLGIHVGYVGGLTIDKHNNLYLVDQNVATVDVYPPGSSSPSKKLVFAHAYDVAVNKKSTQLYVSEAFVPDVTRVTLPAGTVDDTITAQLVDAFGVATSPDGSK